MKDSIESKTHNIDCLEATLTEKYRSPDQSEITPENGLVITLRTHPYFELQYSEKKSIIKIQQDIFKIRNLLSIICGEALTVSYASYESKTIDIGGNPMPFYGQFYFDQTDVTRRANQVTSALH
ncbi:ApeA N-terminal domain 1-containing protein [Alkalibacterium sp. s-m-28]